MAPLRSGTASSLASGLKDLISSALIASRTSGSCPSASNVPWHLGHDNTWTPFGATASSSPLQRGHVGSTAVMSTTIRQRDDDGGDEAPATTGSDGASSVDRRGE